MSDSETTCPDCRYLRHWKQAKECRACWQKRTDQERATRDMKLRESISTVERTLRPKVIRRHAFGKPRWRS